ncbi:MAG: short-subunit dehydrogenase [Verrucomicrobiales bacterium]|jgi:short-subunit dehydrogenase
MKELAGRVAAISGAASGIGRALAIDLAARGTHLALSDVDEDGLLQTVRSCETTSVSITTSNVDVSDRDAVYAWADAVVAEHGRVNMIFNNAGVNLTREVKAQTIEDIAWVMDIDFWGVVHGTQAFLPHLRASGEGHVINISSVFGLLSIPTQSAYNAAKFGVRGYTDALRIELDLERASVSATTVHPGGIKTSIARNARSADPEGIGERFDKMAKTSPEKAARQIIKAVQRNRRRALIGPDAVFFDLTSRMPAAVNQRIVRSASRRASRGLPKT